MFLKLFCFALPLKETKMFCCGFVGSEFMKIGHEQVKSFSCKSKLSSPALRDPSVVHSDLRFPFLAYFYPKLYTFRPKFIFKKGIDQLLSANVNEKKM